MKNILILGAKGGLGQQLVKVFSQYSEVGLPLGKSDFLTIGWDRAEVDITKRLELEEKILALRPEIIINAAAYNDVDGAEREAALANLINGQAVGWLAQICLKIGATLIHFSTDYVFKGDNKEGYTEKSRPDPQGAYAKSKFLGESKILKIRPKFYLIRTSRLFGPLALGSGVKASFVETILRLAKEKPGLEVVDAEVSAPTYTPDLASATKNLILGNSTSSGSRTSGGIYHLTNSGACTWYEWAKKIAELVHLSSQIKPVPASHWPRRASRPAFSILLNTKLPPLRPWPEALKEFLISNF